MDEMKTLRERDTELEKLWVEFGDLPMNPDTEEIEAPFLGFPAGTNREDIWHWFDERHSKGVSYLLYGIPSYEKNGKKNKSAKPEDCDSSNGLNGRYAKLAKDLRNAAEYGKSKMGCDDGGTCNFDSPTLYLPRWDKEKVKKAAEVAGLKCFEWKPFGRTFWVFSVPYAGQGYTRTYAAEAISAYLNDVGYDAGMYYQAD